MKFRNLVLTALGLILAGCQPPPPGHVLTYQIASNSAPVDLGSVAEVIEQRLGPRVGRVRVIGDGRVVVEVFGSQDDETIKSIKRRIGSGGKLEFRITAQPNRSDIRPIINQAMKVPAEETAVWVGGAKVAEWVGYTPEEFGALEMDDQRIVKRMAGETPQALVLIDHWNIDGSYLTSAKRGLDDRGGPSIHFRFNIAGAGRFRQLTSENLPNPTTGEIRYLGMLLEKQLISAPSIQSMISDQGQISGSAITEDEVDNIIAILQAGALPAPITLISESNNPIPAGTDVAIPFSPILLVLAVGVLTLVLVATVTLVVKLR